jgi:small conductance mechanosensitive channel
MLQEATMWGKLTRIAVLFLAAWLVQRSAFRLTGRLGFVAQLGTRKDRPMRTERRRTLRRLVASFLTFLAWLMAMVFSLTLFVEVQNIIWLVGLFAAGFGLGARPLVSDFLTGISFVFEDTFDVGEKVEFLTPAAISGVVEEVNLRQTVLRAPTGELYTIPNGEIRVVRNFGRGSFSRADVVLRIESADLARALPLLEQLGAEAATLLPNLLEPWTMISQTGSIGGHVDITLIAKAHYGTAAETRLRMLALIHDRLAHSDVDFVN